MAEPPPIVKIKMNTSTFTDNRRAFLSRYYILITFVITLWSPLACSNNVVGETSPTKPTGIDLSQTIDKGEQLFAERKDIENLRSAVKLLSDARDPSARNFDIEWRFAKFNYFLGKASTDEAEKTAAFEAGKDAALIASRVEPEKPDGHFWYAANLGELSQLSPITVGIKSIDDIRSSMTQVITIDPAYQGASAFDALGQLELKTRMYGGKAEKAVEVLEQGLAINGTNPNIKVHLAEAYLAVKRDADARKQIDQLLKLDADPAYTREHAEAVSKARKLLETRF